MKKILSVLLIASITLLTITGCGNSTKTSSASSDSSNSSTEHSSGKTVRLGMLSGHTLPIIAEHNGYFKDQGVNVEIKTFSTGAAEIEAYTAGELDIIETGDLPVINGVLNGVDLKIVGSYSSSYEINALLVRDDAGIKQLSDLKGHTVSVPLGSNIQSLMCEYLAAGGLTTDDVEILNLSGNDAVSALENGDTDACVVWEPYVSMAEAKDGISILMDTSDFRLFVCPISTSSTFIKDRGNDLQKVLDALNEAATWEKKNDKEAADICADYFQADNSEAELISIQKADISVPLTDEKVKALEKGAEANYKYGIISQKFDIDSIIDRSFSEKMEAANEE